MTRRRLSPRAKRLKIGIERDIAAAEAGFVKEVQPPPPMVSHDLDDAREPEAIPGKATDEEAKVGNLIWHSIGGDGGADVGLSLGLGEKTMWVGEITKDRWAELSDDQKATLGNNDFGWWLMLYPDCTPLARFADPYDAHEFVNEVFGAIQRAMRGEAA